MPTLRRKWFRFSLRTMLVLVVPIAIVMGWVGVQLKWIRDRREAYPRLEEVSIGRVDLPAGWTPDVPAPWPLPLFGEKSVVARDREVLLAETDPELQRMRRLFPELRIRAESREPDEPATH